MAAVVPNWAPGPMLKSWEKSKPVLGWPRTTDSLCPTCVREVRAQGLLVVSLNMAGSVPEAADLVVTDPVQAGVMTVMAIADTAKFRLERLARRVF